MKFKEESDYQILKLTEVFYKNYPNPPYKEILQKNQRAYDCLLLQSHYDYFICIPYRSHISHPYAYHFKESIRSKKSHSGLDYSKIVEKEFERRYHFSPLKYFHRELTVPFSGATLERQTGSWCAG